MEYTQLMKPKALWNEISRGRSFNTTQIDKVLVKRFRSPHPMDNEEQAHARKAGLDVVGGFCVS